MRGSIQGQGAAYRQGVVLGLTMAELMLLLVFCLLAATGALLARQQGAVERAERRHAELRRVLARNETVAQAIRSDETLSRLVQLPKASGSAAQPVDDNWTRLVAADQAVQAVEHHGLTRQALKDGAAFFGQAEKLRQKGMDAAEIQKDVALSRAIEQALGTEAARRLTPEQVGDLVRRGQSALEPVSPAAAAAGNGPGSHDWPPIIRLSEANGHYFPVGSAEVSPDLARVLRTSVAEKLAGTLKAYDVDVIEVIGHTDDLPVAGRGSNLDRALADVVRDRAPVSDLVPADNAGLGLARAVAVARVLMADPRLAGYRILPLSAAQMTGTDERLSTPGGGDVKERRRIEIRVRRSSG